MQNNTPKFLPGTDIRTGSSAPDSVITQSSTISMNGKISKKIKSENPFIRYTIDNLSTTFNASTQNRSDEIMKRVDTDRFTTSLDYNLRFPSDNYIEAFQWLEKVPIVGDSMSKTKFFYTPSSFNSSIKLNQSLVEKQSRSVEDVVDDFNLGLTRNFSVAYKVFDNLQLNYNKNIQSDMAEYRDEVLKALTDFETGDRTNNTESFASNFSPKWISWFSPNFTYNANYSWNKPKSSVFDGANIVSVRNSGFSFSLSPTEVIEIFYTPASKRNTAASKTRTRSREDIGSASVDMGDDDLEKSDKNNSERKNKRKINDSLRMEKIYGWSKKIEPLSFTINNTTNLSSNGVQGSVPLNYRLGFSDSHDLEYAPEIGLNTGVDDIKKSLSIRSGIKFNPSTSMSISFSESISSNLNGYGIDIRSVNRDYFSYGEHLSSGLPFSNWSFRIGGLEKIKFIGPYVKSLSMEHAVSYTHLSCRRRLRCRSRWSPYH